MAANIITTEDLKDFKNELLEDIKAMINHQSGFNTKKWLKSPEVRELLNISPGTLQNLRINGTLPYTKIGGLIYYDHDEIQKILTQNRIHNKF
ncbi:helix-turn-helix domain-containing protein [Geojedonia litorea]|uniref:Helix-turn-helix domain-containing protein n=1 Tax=Geojedonia litorea TaxID=1268269 RepID=A0ABV9N5N5_9FLAO